MTWDFGYRGGTSITDILNIWNGMGVFSYVLPFLLIFAVVFAVLDRSRMFYRKGVSGSYDDNENRGIIAIIAASVSLLSLQFDFVPEFFGIIFPRFGVGLALFLVILIFIGFFYPNRDSSDNASNKVAWVGWVVGIGVFIWSLSEWDEWGSYASFGGWFSEYIWAIIILGIVIAVIATVASSGRNRRIGE